MNTDFFLNVFVLSARFLPERSVRLQQQHEGHCPGTSNYFLSVPCMLCTALLYVVPNKVQSTLVLDSIEVYVLCIAVLCTNLKEHDK